jgi:hypothetical protein
LSLKHISLRGGSMESVASPARDGTQLPFSHLVTIAEKDFDHVRLSFPLLPGNHPRACRDC